MLDKLDDGARIGVWAALGVVALLLFGLLGALAIKQMNGRKAGVVPERIALRKLETTAGDGSHQEARRVEVRLQP